MLKLLTRVAAAAVALALLGACGNGSTKDTKAGATSPLRVGVYPGLIIDLPVVYADEAGLFKKHGVDVTLVGIGDGPSQVAAAANGSIDAFAFTGNGAMVANGAGQDFQVVTGLVNTSIYAVVAQKGLSSGTFPDNMAEAKGKKFGVTKLGSDDYLVARTLLGIAGLDPDKDTQLLAGGDINSKLAQFKAKQVDYQIMTEPGISLLTAGQNPPGDLLLDVRKPFTDSPFHPWMGQALFAKPSVADAKSSAFKAFNAAIAEAIKFVSDPANIETLLPIMAKSMDLDKEILTAALKNTQPTFSSELTCEAVTNSANWAVEQKQITQAQVPTCEKFIWRP